MAKAYIYIIVLIFSSMAFGQKVTEKDLSGTWILAAFESGGVNVDYKNGTVTFSPDAKEKYGDNAETLKESMVNEINSHKREQQLFFEDGNKVLFRKEGEEVLTWHYFLLKKENVQYIHMNGGDFKMTMSGKTLVLLGEEGGQEIIMTYEKTGEKK